MSDFKVSIPKDSINKNDNSLTFELKGDIKYGLDKTIVNGIRRILISSLPAVAFRIGGDNPDLVMVKNNTSLHNEFLLHRIALIPLYLNPYEWHKDLLFKLTIKNDTKNLMSISAKKIEIYKIKPSIMLKCKENGDFSSLENVTLENYDLTNALPDEDKKKIFRPYEIDDLIEYCLITELGTTKSEGNFQELELYGSPSVSTCNEDVRWQTVSCATYSFKEDEKLFGIVAKEKMIINNIPNENKKQFVKELHISEGERYFHRDINLEPFWYNFKIDSQNYFGPHKTKKGDGLLVRACDLLIKIFEGLKLEFKKILDPESDPIMGIKKADEKNDLIYKIVMQGGDDTIGSVLQAHICNKMINDDSIFSLCGYKKLHPLEEIITFTISLNKNNKIVKLDNIQKINAIIDQMIQGCDEVSLIYQKINEECKKI